MLLLRLGRIARTDIREARQALSRQVAFAQVARELSGTWPPNATRDPRIATERGEELRALVREGAGLPPRPPAPPTLADGLKEFEFLLANRRRLRRVFEQLAGKRVLFVGQAYYNGWYLSRALRHRGWLAELLNWDTDAASRSTTTARTTASW